MPKIKFLQTVTVKDDVGNTYKEGETHEFSESSANHWLSRGVAIPVPEKEVKADVPVKKSKPKKPSTSS